MRIVVFSDSHGDIFAAMELVRRNKEVKTFIFLGDGADELNTLRERFPHKEFIGVRGNCDFFCKLPTDYTADICGKKIFCTHGHMYDVKYSDKKLVESAKSRGVDIVLYGHTHRAVCRYEDGLYVVCPGSISKPADYTKSYATIDITEQGIFCNIVEMK